MSAKKTLRFAPHTCPASVQRIKWEICVLCQDHGGTLIRPAVQAGYTPLHEINSLPLNSEISRLNDGKVWRKLLLAILLNGIKPAMFFFCNAARKRKENVSQELPHSPVQTAPTQHKHSLTFYENEIQTVSRLVFFCDDTTGNLTKVES